MMFDDSGNQLLYGFSDGPNLGYSASPWWIESGASAPPPTSQPSFNSPVTQDSFGIFDQIATGVESAAKSLTQILGTTSSVQSAVSNAKTQGVQLATQSQSQTQVQRAQSTAQIQSAQANANIATAFAQLTANPIVLVLFAIVLFLAVKKLA